MVLGVGLRIAVLKGERFALGAAVNPLHSEKKRIVNRLCLSVAAFSAFLIDSPNTWKERNHPLLRTKPFYEVSLFFGSFGITIRFFQDPRRAAFNPSVASRLELLH